MGAGGPRAVHHGTEPAPFPSDLLTPPSTPSPTSSLWAEPAPFPSDLLTPSPKILGHRPLTPSVCDSLPLPLSYNSPPLGSPISPPDIQSLSPILPNHVNNILLISPDPP